jgi:hypothetical protein
LLPQVVVTKLIVFVFEGLELDVVTNVCRRRIDSLGPLLLTFIDLLAYVRHVV